MRFLRKCLGGHINIGRLTIYGFNAMHVAFNYTTDKTYICFHPPMRCFGKWWPWHFYISRNGTPWLATCGFGPGFEWLDRKRLKRRKHLLLIVKRNITNRCTGH